MTPLEWGLIAVPLTLLWVYLILKWGIIGTFIGTLMFVALCAIIVVVYQGA